jgi:hypothetical protein
VTVLAPPLDKISEVARPYPADLLPEGGTALALFAAAFLGHNDAIHFARKDMQATCVDIDRDRLMEMAALYPDDWFFFQGDAWTWAEDFAALGSQFDVVSVDTFTGEAMERSLLSLPLWCSIARQMVTATLVNGSPYVVPAGWRAHLYPRTDAVSWLVLQRA